MRRERMHIGRLVVVNTGGDDHRAVIVWDVTTNPALKGFLRVQFENGNEQWIPQENIRPLVPATAEEER